MGYRYRIHGIKLPGKPDVIFTKRKKAIFIHGCFWHLHDNCKISRYPKTNTEYWQPKLEKNKLRDAENLLKLKELGWTCLVLWECQLNNLNKIKIKIKKFLND
jgi:DNA mismatch endonuclease (patch repair protein)